MAKNKKKFFVVWKGVNPGIYNSWEECKAQTHGFEGAQYKSFKTLEEATKAFQSSYWRYIKKTNSKKRINRNQPAFFDSSQNLIQDSLSVDAACSGNPGVMEYRGVYVQTGEEIFYQGPFEEGTNNIGEFLALVHGLALLKQKNSKIPIYTDSKTALAWVRNKKAKTTLEQTAYNKPLFELIKRAEKWLDENEYSTSILKWNTSRWGEIPADFGRK